MDEADMAQVREAFVTAAKRALRIGFDSIELHMAHGYLMHSFVSPISNKRNDAYGGSLEGRMKFPLEVLRAVRAVLPKDFPLGARISCTDWMDGGLTGDDSVAWVAAMKQAGLDFVCVSSGGVTAEVRTPTTPGYNVPIAEQIRRETGIATRVGRPDRDAAAGRGDRRRRQGRHDRARPRHAGGPALGLDRRQGARRARSRARCSICAPPRRCGRARPIATARRRTTFPNMSPHFRIWKFRESCRTRNAALHAMWTLRQPATIC